MRLPGLAAGIALAIAASQTIPARLAAQTPNLTGRWTLNRDLSQFPRDVGFTADWMGGLDTGSSSGARSGGGRGGRGGGSSTRSPSPFTQPESETEAKRVQMLTAEVRTPSRHLRIAEDGAAITITDDDKGASRTFHANGVHETLTLDGVPVGVTTRREPSQVVVVYDVEKGRQLRYTYARSASPPQLIVDIEFVEPGGGDHVHRVYEPTTAAESEAMAAAQAAPATAAARPASGLPPAAAPAGTNPAATGRPAESFNQKPDAELKGLTQLGIVVEDLGPQAAACTLTQSTLEDALAKRLTDAGFRVRRNADDDTYLYVNIMTTSASAGLCVSRYDAFLYSHATTTLTYQQAPVLVQVQLLHKGGIAGGAPATHGAKVLEGLLGYVDQFVARIRDAGK